MLGHRSINILLIYIEVICDRYYSLKGLLVARVEKIYQCSMCSGGCT